MSKNGLHFMRRFSQLLMLVDAVCLVLGIAMKFSYSYLSFFGGMAAGFLFAEVFIVHRVLELFEWRLDSE